MNGSLCPARRWGEYDPNPREHLFDLANDPGETRDLSGDAGLLAPLRDRMASEVARTGGVTYERAALKPCANQTPSVF